MIELALMILKLVDAVTRPSKTQIDRLGDRLRKGPLAEADLKALDDYRRSFGKAYDSVVRAIRERTQLEPTGRPAKSTGALIQKLHRESIRLTQVQDIAGCRVLVPDGAEQERVLKSLRTVFPVASIVDRRATPSYGYRAVHVIVQTDGVLVEIQVRTLLQHLWAELSEKFSDVVDPAIKYGGGSRHVRKELALVSSSIAGIEAREVELETSTSMLAEAKSLVARHRRRPGAKEHEKTIRKIEKDIASDHKTLLDGRMKLINMLYKVISTVQKLKRPRRRQRP